MCHDDLIQLMASHSSGHIITTLLTAPPAQVDFSWEALAQEERVLSAKQISVVIVHLRAHLEATQKFLATLGWLFEKSFIGSAILALEILDVRCSEKEATPVTSSIPALLSDSWIGELTF